MNYKKINNCFFLISVLCTFLIVLFNSIIFKIDFEDLFFTTGLMSLLAGSICFYRFNNGLISIFRGRFGKPSRKDKHYVEYEQIDDETAEALKKVTDFSKNSLLLYKLNTRDIYQIIKKNDRLYFHICKNKDDLISNFNNIKNLPLKRKEYEILYDEIKSVIYSISSSNFDQPIITISTEKKKYRFIGYIEPLDTESVKNFFEDIAKVTIKKNSNSSKKKYDLDKLTFKYNILQLAGCIFAPQALVLTTNIAGSKHILTSVYSLITISVLIIFALLPIIRPDRYIIGIFAEKLNSKKKEVGIAFELLIIALLVPIIRMTILNFTYYIILTVVMAVIMIVTYFNRVKIKKKKVVIIFLTIFVYLFFSASVIGNINYLIPIKTEVQPYNVIDRHITQTKDSEHYIYTVSIDGKEEIIEVDSETYESRKRKIDIRKTTGLLGITYVTQEGE